jgi:hypothetical protein
VCGGVGGGGSWPQKSLNLISQKYVSKILSTPKMFGSITKESFKYEIDWSSGAKEGKKISQPIIHLDVWG